MYTRNKYWIVSLSLLLSLSLALPYCCDAIAIDMSAHSHEMSAHDMHGQQSDAPQSCTCGHELTKEYQKNKKVVNGPDATPFFAGQAINKSKLHYNKPDANLSFIQSGILAGTGPPLHLLNSVFLN